MKLFRILLVMIFWIGGNALAQSNPPKARPIDMKFNSVSKQDSTWQFLANEASKVRVFMGGENHQEVDFNSLMEYGFMNRLHKYAGYRHYVIELSPARAHYLNRYIKYSDTHARDALKGVSSPKYMNLFENLHRWNQGLDEDERITVHGVDVERFYDLSFERLAESLRNKLNTSICPDSILPDVLAIVSYANRRFNDRLAHYKKKINSEEFNLDEDETSPTEFFYRFDYHEYVDRIERDLLLYKDWLGATAFHEFSMALQGVKECNKWDDDSKSASRFHWRETVMYGRYVAALDQYPNGKFFGQFGRCHISETPSDVDCGWYAYESVVSRLVSQYFKNKDSVITIGYFYKDKNPTITAENIENQTVLKRELQQLLRPYNAGMVIYDLNDRDTDLQELRKKFRFVLVNNTTDAALSTEKPTEDYGDSSVGSNWPVSVSMSYIGVSYWSIKNPGMEQHFRDQNLDLKFPFQMGIQHQLNLNYGPLVFGIGGYYSVKTDNDELFAVHSDSSGALFSQFWGVDALAGIHLEKNAWIVDIAGRIGPARLEYTYREKVEAASTVSPVNGLTIHNQSWNAGISANLFYRIANEAGFGLQANTFYNIGNGTWIYSGSNQTYKNLSMNSGLQGWSVTAQIALFFSN